MSAGHSLGILRALPVVFHTGHVAGLYKRAGFAQIGAERRQGASEKPHRGQSW